MKKSVYISIIVLVLGLSTAFAHAETPVAVAAPAPIQQEPPKADPVVETLTTRKQKAEIGLRAIQTQFSSFTTRTQVAIDRLNAKKIDTVTAQTELTLATASLATAKTELDAFEKVVITDDADEKTTDELKTSLKKIEDSLKETRTHLIASLTALKASVAETVDTQPAQ